MHFAQSQHVCQVKWPEIDSSIDGLQTPTAGVLKVYIQRSETELSSTSKGQK